MVACRLIPVLVVACAAGCGGSLYQLRRVASRENSCPLDKIEAFYCKNDVGLLNVCGTYRRYNYQGLHAEGRLFPPHSWQEVGIAANLFRETWLDLRLGVWGADANAVWVVGTGGKV